MPDHNNTYKIIDLVGTSDVSSDDAIRNAISKASQSIKELDWFQVVETRGFIKDGAVGWFQVTLKIGFRILDASELDSH